jgi:hypothetical protein
MRAGHALLLLVGAVVSAHAQGCDGDEGDTYAEMITSTDECGETSYEDTCGAFVTLNDNDVLEEELGACKIANYGTDFEGVSPPNAPEVLATVSCGKAQTPSVRFFWVAPNGNGADVDRFEVSVWAQDGDMVRSYAAAAASGYEQEDGSYALVENGLAAGRYTARVKAFNSAGQSADGVSVTAEVPEPVPPAVATVTVWGSQDGSVHVKASVPRSDDTCNAPTAYSIRPQKKSAAGSWEFVDGLRVESPAPEHVYMTTGDRTEGERKGALVEGRLYRFIVVASSTHGIADPSVPVEFVARAAPAAPVLTHCGAGVPDFSCKVLDGCTGRVKFSWTPVVARGPATDRITYDVRAFVDGQTTPSTTLTGLSVPDADLKGMQWALGKRIRFDARASARFVDVAGVAQVYHGAWSARTAAVAIPGPATTPQIKVSVDPTRDRVTVSWRNNQLRWLEGTSTYNFQRFKVFVKGSRGENQKPTFICAVRMCADFSGPWPTECANRKCEESFEWDEKPVISYDPADAVGLSFRVQALGTDHHNCGKEAQGPSGVFLVAPPKGPAAVLLARSDLRTSTGGSLAVSFAQSVARADVRVTAYRVEIFSDAIGFAAQRSVEIVAPADPQAEVQYVFNGLRNGVRYYAKVSAKNWRNWGVPTRSNEAECTPVSTIRVTGATLEFKGLSVAQYKAEPGVEPKLKHAIATALTKASTQSTVVAASQVTITSVTDGRGSLGARRLAVGSLSVGFDVDIPFASPGMGATSSLNSDIATSRISAMRAADDVMVSMLTRRASFVDALGADLNAQQFPFNPPLLLASGLARDEHVSRFNPEVVAGLDGAGAGDGDRTAYGETKGPTVAGMSSYAFVLLVCGVGVIMLGGVFAVMARRRSMAALTATPAPTGGVPTAPAPTQNPTGWKRASIKAPMQAGGGGTETSFFESEVGSVDDAPPASFVNPAESEASQAAKRQALRKSSQQFMKQSTKNSLHTRRSKHNLMGGKAAAPGLSGAMGAADVSGALPDGDSAARMERTVSVSDAMRGSI